MAPREQATTAGATNAPDSEAQNKGKRNCLHQQLQKTKFCTYHLQGGCRYGSACSFAHSISEMHAAPDLRKTQLCKAFQRGQCNNEDCTFAHGRHELRSTGVFFKKTLCIWNEKGKCRNGAECRFAHGVGELHATKAGANSATRAAGGQRANKVPALSSVSTSAHSEEATESEGSNDLEPMKVRLPTFEAQLAADQMEDPESADAALNSLLAAQALTLAQLQLQHMPHPEMLLDPAAAAAAAAFGAGVCPGGLDFQGLEGFAPYYNMMGTPGFPMPPDFDCAAFSELQNQDYGAYAGEELVNEEVGGTCAEDTPSEWVDSKWPLVCDSVIGA